MNTAKVYKDSEGNDCNILQMVKREPEWAANRIQVGEDAIEELRQIKAALAQPDNGGMAAIDISDDDSLRFVQRVLESDAPEADRMAARDMIVGIRTRVREIAKPEAEPVGFIDQADDGIFGDVNTGICEGRCKVGDFLYTHTQPEKQPLSENEIKKIIANRFNGDELMFFEASLIELSQLIEAAVWEKMGCK
jgi:hypothetical protein